MNLKMEDFDKEIKNINSTVSEQENHIKEVNLTVSEYGDEIKEMNTTLSEGIEKNSILIKELQAFHEGNLTNSSLIEEMEPQKHLKSSGKSGSSILRSSLLKITIFQLAVQG